MSPAGVYLLFGLTATTWVAFDSRRFDWRGNAFCDRAWKWVLGCLFLFVVAFPAYMWQRRKVPARALLPVLQANPAVAGGPSPGGSVGVAVRTEPTALPADPVASPVQEPARGSLALAVPAGAGVAFLGGVVWAG